MILKELKLRNFKSYGNNEQVLTISDSGSLVLLSGDNGSGKSSLKNSISFNFFGKSRGSKKKWSSLSTLSNRMNGELITKTISECDGINVEIHRGLNPTIFKLFENGIEDENSSKSHIEDKIEKYIGMDADTFNSFISMSINDFKNFISLSSDDKQMLLDRLFNLEVINTLKSILIDLNKSNKSLILKYDSEISILSETINAIKIVVDVNEIDSIKELMSSKKDEYIKLKERINLIKNKIEEIKELLDNERIQYSNILNQIKNSDIEIGLYKSGKCPTCKTDFNNDHFIGLLDVLIEKNNSLKLLGSDVEVNLNGFKDKLVKLKGLLNTNESSLEELTQLLNNSKNRLTELSVNVDIHINDIVDRKDISVDKLKICKERELYYRELGKVLGDDGVKKSIISGIIGPINKLISDNIKKMGLNFGVILDDSFNATITQFGSVIEHDTLSSGEDSKINICVLIAYLKIIRNKKNFNILFLDEVFASIDVKSIPQILSLMKSFSEECGINIFIVHHAILNDESFDRIIGVNKDLFSNITNIK